MAGSIDYTEGMAQARKDAAPMDEGEYDGMIRSAMVTTAKSSGNDMVSVSIIYDDPDGMANRNWVSFISLVREGRASFDRIFRTLKAFGATDTEIDSVDSRETLHELVVKYLVNRDVTVILTIDDSADDGVARNSVRFFNPR